MNPNHLTEVTIMKEQIITKVIELVFTVLTTIVVSVLLPAVKAWLQSKTENERLKAIIADVTSAVATCVDHAEQTVVSVLKDKGEWNETTQAEVLETVMYNVIDTLLETTKDNIEANGIDIETMIAQRIEAYIQQKKVGEKNEDN